MNRIIALIGVLALGMITLGSAVSAGVAPTWPTITLHDVNTNTLYDVQLVGAKPVVFCSESDPGFHPEIPGSIVVTEDGFHYRFLAEITTPTHALEFMCANPNWEVDGLYVPGMAYAFWYTLPIKA